MHSCKELWHCMGGRVVDPSPFLVVGILNITPDSFYDGGSYANAQEAGLHALKMLKQGAGIIDIGGESTRPFSKPIGDKQELERVLPVLTEVKKLCPDSLVSVDTYRAEVARQCLEQGADIINDVSACVFDPYLLDVLVDYKPGYVLMHSLGRPENMQNSPQYENVVDQVLSFLQQKMNMLVARGLPEENIVIDPGIGFGKLLEHNLELLRNIEKFCSLGRPIYMGLSNKSLWSQLLNMDISERPTATLAATCSLAQRGILIHRVHQVQEAVWGLKIVQALRPEN